MGKIGRLTRSALRKDFLIGFIGTFLAVLGVPSALVTMLGGHLSLRATCGLVVLALLVSVIVNRRKLSGSWRLPLPGKRTLRCPCDFNLTNQVAKLARYEFGRDTISLTNYEPLRAKNPYILVCLIGADGDFLGYFDVIPLKKNFAELFLQGKVGERDLTHEDILAARDARRCKYVYIAGLAARDSDTQTGQENGVILLWGLFKYLDHFYGGRKAYAFASAATGDGEDLLKSFKVPLLCDAKTRADGHKMYGLSLSRDQIVDRLACLPDYTLLCAVDWVRSNRSRKDTLPVPRRPSLPQKKRRALSA